MDDLLGWVTGAAVISLIAGALSFTGVAQGAVTAAKWLFGVFLLFAVVLFIMVALGLKLLF